MNDMDKAKKLAEEHWAWLESILFQQRLIEKKIFIDSFIHGYKHGLRNKEVSENEEETV